MSAAHRDAVANFIPESDARWEQRSRPGRRGRDVVGRGLDRVAEMFSRGNSTRSRELNEGGMGKSTVPGPVCRYPLLGRFWCCRNFGVLSEFWVLSGFPKNGAGGMQVFAASGIPVFGV